MIPTSLSVLLLSLLSLVVFFGWGQRVLDRMRLKNSTALILLLAMLFGHFLPTIKFTSRFALNLGAAAPLGVAIYLLATTSAHEGQRAALISVLTAFFLLLTDKLLPPDPGLLDPILAAGVFAGLLSYIWSRSRRSAFSGAIFGVLLADLFAGLQLFFMGIPQTITLGSGGMLSSLVASAFLAVLIAEVIGEIRERLMRGPALKQGGSDDD
ncbi:MAG TPA: hypothetical protein GX528_09695 [Firmicutes bacterium]|nr:hypothetical protein [Bacillota bacterium]